MVKLVAHNDNHRWSFFNGYYIFSNVVWCSEKDIYKYRLIDEEGNNVEGKQFDIVAC